jgi:hypothetical protein
VTAKIDEWVGVLGHDLKHGFIMALGSVFKHGEKTVQLIGRKLGPS